MINIRIHKAVWSDISDESCIQWHIMAVIDGKGVGTGTLKIYDNDPSYCVLNSLNVSVEYRHLNIGLRLQEIRENIGREHGCKDAYLWVEKWTWLRKWYKRRGYVYHEKHQTIKNNVWLIKKL